MASGREFIESQDAKIKRARERFDAAARDFSKSEEAGSNKDEQIKRLSACQDAAREFFRELNDAVADPGDLKGKLFDRWKEDRLASAINVLSGLPKHQDNIRNHRTRLGVSATKYEFSPAVFDNMQAIVAWERPKEAKRLRALFQASELPSGGFDRPRKMEAIAEEMPGMNARKQKTTPNNPEQSGSEPLNSLSQASIVKAAAKAIPAFKYAIGVAGLAALIVTIIRYGASPATLVFGAIILLVLMVLLLVFTQAARIVQAKKSSSAPATAMIWSFMVLAIMTAVLLFTSAFFDKPLPFRTYLIRQLGTDSGKQGSNDSGHQGTFSDERNNAKHTRVAGFPLSGTDERSFSSSKHAKCEVSLDSTGKLAGTLTLENDTLFSGFSANLVVALLDQTTNELETISLQGGSIDGKPPGKAIHRSIPIAGQIANPKHLNSVSSIKVTILGG